MSINKVILGGNLVRNAELKNTSGGTAVLTGSIAVNERRKNNQTGEWESYPNYFDFVMYGARAEKMSTWFTKGRKVVIEGRMHQDRWQKDGQNRSKDVVIVEEFEFMDRGENVQNNAHAQTVQNEGILADSDIPF